MRLITLLSLLPLLSSALARSNPHIRTYDTHQYYTLELSTHSVSLASSIAEALGVEVVEQLGELDGHWLVRVPGSTPLHNSTSAAILDSDPIIKRWHGLRKRQTRSTKHQSLRSLTPLTLRKRAKRDDFRMPPRSRHGLQSRDDTEFLYAQNEIGITDPMLNLQWHLINTEQKDVELNVTGLWGRNITGTGVKVAMIDDGLDFDSEDLKDNFFPEGSYDFNDHTVLPKPRLSDDQHGTRCAGEIAAVKNDVCGVGVAYTSKVAGIRILSAPISDADEAAALNFGYQVNDIYSCSWGPPDDGKSMEAPDGVILKAMVNGVHKGRGGKGSVFVFAAGNGGGAEDQCNFDGYTNSIFSITVGAIDRKGLHPYYSELCAAMMVVTPSSGSGDHIHTTDVGENVCAHTHGGTSAAAPLAAGVFALALEVRPDLTWRDFQHLAIRTAVHINPDDPDWQLTANGRPFSYKYGFGKLDAGLFVEAAEKWKVVKPQAWYDCPAVHLPDDPDVERRLLDAPMTAGNADQEKPKPSDGDNAANDQTSPETGPEGDDEDKPNPPPLVKPSGTTITAEGITSSFEVTQEMLDNANLETLEHITVRVWIDHQRRGDVEIKIDSPNKITSVLARTRRYDEDNTGFPGWKFMSLKHWGEDPIGTWTITVTDRVNPDKTGRFIAWALQLWGESADPSLIKQWQPAEEGEPDEEEIGSPPTTTGTQKKPKPTDHLPDNHGHAEGEADQPGLGDPELGGEGATDPTGQADEGFFNGIQSLASSSSWIAGAGMIIVLVGAGVGAFFFFRARKRRRNLFGLSNNGEGARGAYQPVGDDDVPMGLLERGRSKLGDGQGQGSKELYDAFGDGPSDDSDDSRGSDEGAALRYHDDFLGDDEHDEDRSPGLPGYRDEPEDRHGERSGTPQRDLRSQSGSSSSWQDAAEDVPNTKL